MVAFFPETELAGAVGAVEKALARLGAEEFRGEGDQGETFRVTFSAGVAPVVPGESVDAAVGRADRLLYLAKERGRNLVVAERSEDSAGGASDRKEE